VRPVDMGQFVKKLFNLSAQGSIRHKLRGTATGRSTLSDDARASVPRLLRLRRALAPAQTSSFSLAAETERRVQLLASRRESDHPRGWQTGVAILTGGAKLPAPSDRTNGDQLVLCSTSTKGSTKEAVRAGGAQLPAPSDRVKGDRQVPCSEGRRVKPQAVFGRWAFGERPANPRPRVGMRRMRNI
jgi:hypothetical protein